MKAKTRIALSALNVSSVLNREKSLSKIELITRESLEFRLHKCLEQRQMPDCFLYLDEPGVENWLNLSNSEDFPVAARLTDLLRQNLDSIARHIWGRFDIVSIGVGNGEKEQMLLETLTPRCKLSYYAVDISSQMVDEALSTVDDIDINKTGIVAFLEDLPSLRQFWNSPVLLCLLGNNFCNYEPDFLLELVHQQLELDDLFLFDCHLLPFEGEGLGTEKVERIYRSKLNVRFNVDPLVRRGLDLGNCVFHLELLPIETNSGSVYRTKKWLEIRKDTTLSCGSNQISLAAGDAISLGFTYKYTRSQVEDYLSRHGFQTLEGFVSSEGENLLILTRKQPI